MKILICRIVCIERVRSRSCLPTVMAFVSRLYGLGVWGFVYPMLEEYKEIAKCNSCSSQKLTSKDLLVAFYCHENKSQARYIADFVSCIICHHDCRVTHHRRFP
ncbi:hypothetical protein M426DRAFT_165658 [Hypoxylon sp. CI-4A]|nr:hypothetical protein M426DRAFT_165658 [Hypoxylon sp. CI-4A]